ncbi:Glutathione-specific gamma-glutamylcyclotransferase [Pararobbsia alpina]|uniref:gamma-glutamylcyclotransferase n=1 Tax=Pararobbsia alpina TaxID=621374 RepID=UPI0039A6DFA2
MFTRDTIESGKYIEHFDSLPDVWTPQQIKASLEQTLRQRPQQCDELWVFAYGSLMWNPVMQFDQSRLATLHDWHRSFCLHLTVGRGSPEAPGRMLALERGGVAHGVALRLHQANAEEELMVLWIREMVLGSYIPTWAPVTFEDGTHTHAIAFVANTQRQQYAHDSSIDTIAPLIHSASGAFGTNAEYLERLTTALAKHGIADPYLDALEAKLKALDDVPDRANPGALDG